MCKPHLEFFASLVAQRFKCLPAMRETRVRSLGWEDSLEKEMATHSSILAWKISGTEEPGGLPSVGSPGVGHDWCDLACMHACIGEGNGNPLQYSCLENSRDRGAWWAAVYVVTQSWTWLKRLSSSSSSGILLRLNCYCVSKDSQENLSNFYLCRRDLRSCEDEKNLLVLQ